jgi:hypothetical protein
LGQESDCKERRQQVEEIKRPVEPMYQAESECTLPSLPKETSALHCSDRRGHSSTRKLIEPSKPFSAIFLLNDPVKSKASVWLTPVILAAQEM